MNLRIPSVVLNFFRYTVGLSWINEIYFKYIVGQKILVRTRDISSIAGYHIGSKDIWLGKYHVWQTISRWLRYSSSYLGYQADLTKSGANERMRSRDRISSYLGNSFFTSKNITNWNTRRAIQRMSLGPIFINLLIILLHFSIKGSRKQPDPHCTGRGIPPFEVAAVS